MSTSHDVTLSKDCIFKMQNDRFKAFKSQNQEKGFFDVTFDIGGKKLHAHKFILTLVSETLTSMLSDRWTKTDDPIKIADYSYENFYEFIAFLYTGSCDLTTDNIEVLVDIAEFYAVPCFKDYCDQFLCKLEKNADKIEEMYDFGMKYSLTHFLKSIEYYILLNGGKIYNIDKFLAYKKPFVEFLATIKRQPDYTLMSRYAYCSNSAVKEGRFFEAVYKWAENQVLQQRDPGDEKFNLEEAVKAELFTIIPENMFYKMSFTFLMDFVLEKGFLLSPTELSEFFEFLRNSHHSHLKSHLNRIRNVSLNTDSSTDSIEEIVEKPENKEETYFESVYRLAEKQARKRQMLAADGESFSVADSIKADLAEVIPLVKFNVMDEQFVADFAVANGIISEEQAQHILDTRIYIENDGSTISGSFEDQFGIRDACENLRRGYVERQSTTKVSFRKLKFRIPNDRSTVKKMKGVEWYLCLEENQMLALKHHSVVGRSDYLIAEMKGDNDFELVSGEKTFIKASYNNVRV